jgi:hypothetical protein
MHNVISEELPCEGDIVGALGGGAEDKLTEVEILQEISRLQGVDVLELRVVDATHLELTLALGTTIFIDSEGLVDEIFWVILDTLEDKVAMVLEVNSFAGKRGTEEFFIIILDSFDAPSNNISLLDNVLSMTTTKVQFGAVNLGIEPIIKFTQDKARIVLLLNDSDDLCSDYNASFECYISFFNQH